MMTMCSSLFVSLSARHLAAAKEGGGVAPAKWRGEGGSVLFNMRVGARERCSAFWR